MPLRPLHVVWFKRDLRIDDHAPLTLAAQGGPVLPLYILEPELWRQPDVSGRHFAFLAECLVLLDRQLSRLGQPLVVRTGEAVDVLEAIRAQYGIAGLWSHEETGNGWTFERDKTVERWARANGIEWTELPQNGVVRRLPTRNGWAARWERTMARPPAEPPRALERVGDHHILDLPSAADLGLAPDPCPGRQRGGREAAIADLDSFLLRRGQNYRFEMSSPLTAEASCSRLSTHLAFGTLSMREVAQATRARYGDLQAERQIAPHSPDGAAWAKSLISFTGRLHWHCHFMQKLESEPAIEVRNLHRAYDGLRPETIAPGSVEAARLQAWATGTTGFPFVDACMRSLIHTGWINFRMRAMLVAFASYQLWLPWRPTGLHLARLFTDYEPGIHWPQVQMQSGTTGINTIRMYNPVKQGYDQDPTGVFVRRWLPELAELPDHAIHEPWRFSDLRSIASEGYPDRIVDHEAAARAARDKVWGVRRGQSFRRAADAIQDEHGSRKSGMPITGQRGAGQKGTAQKSTGKRAKSAPTSQMKLDL